VDTYHHEEQNKCGFGLIDRRKRIWTRRKIVYPDTCKTSKYVHDMIILIPVGTSRKEILVFQGLKIKIMADQNSFILRARSMLSFIYVYIYIYIIAHWFFCKGRGGLLIFWIWCFDFWNCTGKLLFLDLKISLPTHMVCFLSHHCSTLGEISKLGLWMKRCLNYGGANISFDD
jgi:hypothetical protein